MSVTFCSHIKGLHFKSAGLDSWGEEEEQKLEHKPSLDGSSLLMPGPQEGQGYRACPFGQPVLHHAWSKEPGLHVGLHTSGPALENKEVCCLTHAGLHLHRVRAQMCPALGIWIMGQQYLFIKNTSAFRTVTWGLYVKRLKYLSFRFT